MSKKLLVVFGATGQQGGSVANVVLSDPLLSSQYSVRAISPDLNDPLSLKAALENAHTVFAMTSTTLTGDTREVETAQAKALCTAAIAAGAQYIILADAPAPDIEQYIRSLPIKSAFYCPAYFMQNFTNQLMPPRPSPANDGSYVFASLCNPDTRMPLIDATEMGKWIAPILESPDEYEGKVLEAMEGWYTWKEIAEIVSSVTGKRVAYQQVSDELFKEWMPPLVKDDMQGMFVFYRNYGFYSKPPGQKSEDSGKAKGKLRSLEEFCKKAEFTFP
ncbi:NmrA family transcriptional regulator [Botrytis cinerea]